GIVSIDYFIIFGLYKINKGKLKRNFEIVSIIIGIALRDSCLIRIIPEIITKRISGESFSVIGTLFR
ncbi:UNVERIFIED_CONTAM: hypothetical protein NY603_34370, partial [Bacteroidetes bacterium 56_B9]